MVTVSAGLCARGARPPTRRRGRRCSCALVSRGGHVVVWQRREQSDAAPIRNVARRRGARDVDDDRRGMVQERQCGGGGSLAWVPTPKDYNSPAVVPARRVPAPQQHNNSSGRRRRRASSIGDTSGAASSDRTSSPSRRNSNLPISHALSGDALLSSLPSRRWAPAPAALALRAPARHARTHGDRGGARRLRSRCRSQRRATMSARRGPRRGSTSSTSPRGATGFDRRPAPRTAAAAAAACTSAERSSPAQLPSCALSFRSAAS